MRSKKEIENELVDIKKKLETISESKSTESTILAEKEASDKTNTSLFSLVKYMFDENRKTTLLLKNISESLARLSEDVHDIYYEDEAAAEPEERTPVKGFKEVPISELDRQILQAVQVLDLACADDIRKRMNYKGRNAASAHLNRLYKTGLLQRHQLGKKVCYKYDAGKAIDTVIVSPPQSR
jgi:hypothetical protein